jgi:hypothetical protein
VPSYLFLVLKLARCREEEQRLFSRLHFHSQKAESGGPAAA